jgi:hypothetical protein
VDCCIDLSPIQQYHQNQKQQKNQKQQQHHNNNNWEISDHAQQSPMATTTDNSRFIERLRACVLLDASSSSAKPNLNPPNQTQSQTTKQFVGTEPTAWMRNNGEYLVHPKLSHFFLMLWYACKIEHVVRNYARCWLDEKIRSSKEETDIASICEAFSQQDDLFNQMCDMLNHALSHVTGSIEAHIASFVQK